jgi:hypothetical protein
LSRARGSKYAKGASRSDGRWSGGRQLWSVACESQQQQLLLLLLLLLLLSPWTAADQRDPSVISGLK